MTSIRRISEMLLLVVLLLGCSHSPKYVTISGNIRNIEADSVEIGKYLLHNLTDAHRNFKTQVIDKHTFKIRVPVDSATVLFLHFEHTEYPIYAEPGQKITINTDAAKFPLGVKVTSDDSRLNSQYNNAYQYFQYQDSKVQKAIEKSLPAFLNGESNDILKLEKLRIRVAMEDFSNTPFDIFVFRTMGDYVIRCMENMNNHHFDNRKALDQERNKIIDNANQMGFFTLRSLMAQHSNLDDFIKEYILSYKLEASRFPSMESLPFSENIGSYDMPDRMFYHAVNHLLNRITDPRAKKYLSAHFHDLQKKAITCNSKTGNLKGMGIEKFVALYSNHKKYSNYLQTQISRRY